MSKQLGLVRHSKLDELSDDDKLALHYASQYCLDVLNMPSGVQELPDKSHTGMIITWNWTHWFVLREGPDFVAKAWTSKTDKEACTEYILGQLRPKLIPLARSGNIDGPTGKIHITDFLNMPLGGTSLRRQVNNGVVHFVVEQE